MNPYETPNSIQFDPNDHTYAWTITGGGGGAGYGWYNNGWYNNGNYTLHFDPEASYSAAYGSTICNNCNHNESPVPEDPNARYSSLEDEDFFD